MPYTHHEAMLKNPALRSAAICAGLIVLVLIVYGQVSDFGFVAIDDRSYVVDNPHVLGGLNGDSLAWAFTTRAETHWAPLTWISLMLDAELHGDSPRGFHITNVILHAANALLLFYLLTSMTGCAARSAFVAALFAIHPLHVESVAWITERKDVLSTFFFMLAVLAYARYAARPGTSRYALVLALFAMGLMSKTMIVTMPVLLLLLDFWPLGRFRRAAEPPAGPKSMAQKHSSSGGKSASESQWAAVASPIPRLVLEKLPLLVLSAAASYMAVQGQAESRTLGSLQQFPMQVRAANAFVSCAGYLQKMVWPAGLAIPYPYLPDQLTFARVSISAIVLIGITVLAIGLLGRFPYLFTGWLWYLIALLPVIGLVQAGAQAMADRYTYIPLIGIFLMVAWGVPELVDRFAARSSASARARLLGAGALVVLVLLTSTARVQASHWRSTFDLFSHTLRVTDRNALAHNGLGIDLFEKGRLEQSEAEQKEALRLWPEYADAHLNLAAVLSREGRREEALAHYKEAARLKPGDPEMLSHLGAALLEAGEPEEAAARLTEAVRLEPADPYAREQLGAALARQGRNDDAIDQVLMAVRAKPDDAQARVTLGTLLTKVGRLDEAGAQLAEAVRLAPRNASAHKNLGVVLARQGRLAEAGAQFAEALRLDPSDEGARRNLERARDLMAGTR